MKLYCSKCETKNNCYYKYCPNCGSKLQWGFNRKEYRRGKRWKLKPKSLLRILGIGGLK